MNDLAIIGIACHFPGANDKYQFWENLIQGKSAITAVPDDRKNALLAKNIHAGFISQYSDFDSVFFRISPREAKYMDPQQRLFLQVVFQAVEDAGLDISSLSGKSVGVYVGVMGNEWGRILFNDASNIDIYSGTGNGYCMVANRVSYVFNFVGPSLAIDTACSSSLVAVDYACKALAAHEIDLAIVGGVNIILDSALNEFYVKSGLSSKLNKCQPFGSHSDGIVRGEGAAAIVLKRKTDIHQSSHRAYAYIKSHAVNHNGTSNGITAPKRWAQKEVITKALEKANIKAEEVFYVEAHGTGTQLGDPIEANALSDAIGQYKNNRKQLLIGSVKSNIGHLEGAAGIAGLIKSALSMYYKTIPSSLHFNQGNNYIKFDKKKLSVVQSNVDLSGIANPLYFGVSSFGLGGTNAHVILQNADNYNFIKEKINYPAIIKLSAKSKQSLINNLDAFCNFKSFSSEYHYFNTMNNKPDQCHRVAVVGKNIAEINCEAEKRIKQAVNPLPVDKEVILLFAGQGVQYECMAKELYHQLPIFKQEITSLDICFTKKVGISLKQIILDENLKDKINATEYTQPILFALEYALARIWLALGVKPNYLIGHSIGEYTALCIAGVYDFSMGLSLVVERARLMSEADNGSMLLIAKDKAQVKMLLGEANSQLQIAVINNSRNVVVSGSMQEVDKFSYYLKENNIINKRLKVSGAFHSSLMEKAAEKFKLFCSQYQFDQPSIPVISNVTANAIKEINAEYLVNHIVSPVLFEDSLKNFPKEDRFIYLEIGPGNDMLKMANPTIDNSSIKIQSMEKNNSYEIFLHAVGRLYEEGININWNKLYPLSHLSDSPVYQFSGDSYPLHSKISHETDYRKSNTQNKKIDVASKKGSVNRHLKRIISEVSGTEVMKINRESNFICDLGFDSIMMVSLRNQINQAGLDKQDHSLADLIKLKTVGDLIDYLNIKNRGGIDANN